MVLKDCGARYNCETMEWIFVITSVDVIEENLDSWGFRKGFDYILEVVSQTKVKLYLVRLTFNMNHFFLLLCLWILVKEYRIMEI